ncbi:MAG: hypothetical protein K6B38_00180, partial [Ruminococcus sp.]|nr:hypothetical protein [Ruminococcus sp.]
FTPCKGDNISQREPVPSVSYADISPHCGESPLTPERAPAALFYSFFKVNAVAVDELSMKNYKLCIMNYEFLNPLD